MADDLIYCPSCRHKLQLPTELYGQTVECPQCHTRFAAPVPQAAPPVVRPVGTAPTHPAANYGPGYAPDTQELAWQAAASSARAPAVALLILSLLSGLMWGLVILVGQSAKAQPAVWEGEIRKQLDQNPDIGAEDKDRLLEMMSAENVARYGMIYGGIGLVTNVLTVVGAISMMRLGSYGLAMIGSLAALNPINVPCCLLEAPFGLWALIVLLNGDVRRAFR